MPRKKQSGASNFLIVVLILVSFFAGYLFYKVKTLEQQGKALGTAQQNQPTQAQQQQPATAVSLDKVKSLFSEGYIHFGDAKNKALVVEITDPSCPYCHVAAGQNPELSKQINTRFQYVSDGGSYNPPVTDLKKLADAGKVSYAIVFGNGHGNGFLGMQALYCAFEKGKYWEAHDRLMSNSGYDLLNTKLQNDKKNIPQLVDFLADQVDPDFLTSCLTDGKYESVLSRDEKLGPDLGFQGTPHFLINSTIFNGAVDYKTGGMENAINNLLSK